MLMFREFPRYNKLGNPLYTSINFSSFTRTDSEEYCI